MKMRTARTMVGLAVMSVVFAAASVSAQQAMVAQDVTSLAGKWVGWGTSTSGSNFPVEVEIRPDGSYTSTMGSTIGNGVITMDGGKFMAEGQITGSISPAAGVGKSELTVSSKDGKQMISATGRDQLGPYELRLTKK
jgi:uncharacterized protein (TIGR03066 family)